MPDLSDSSLRNLRASPKHDATTSGSFLKRTRLSSLSLNDADDGPKPQRASAQDNNNKRNTSLSLLPAVLKTSPRQKSTPRISSPLATSSYSLRAATTNSPNSKMSKPRTGIPTPGRPSGSGIGSGIPTPGSRSRSSSLAASASNSSQIGTGADSEYVNTAFKEAIKAHDPANYAGGRTSLASSTSAQSQLRSKTPTSAYGRPPSRSSDVFARSSSRTGTRNQFEVGDGVRIESLGFEGVLRFIGEIDGKQGLWAGVELAGGFAGKGKNDGSVAGKRYFTCPDKCGVFVATTKLSPPSIRPLSVASSVASSRTGRTTPLSSFSTSFSSNALSTSRVARPSLSNGRVTPSATGRVTPSNALSTSTTGVPETPAARAARLRSLQKKSNANANAGTTPIAKGRLSAASSADAPPVPVPGVGAAASLTPGSRAAKYAGMTAKQLTLNKSVSSPTPSTGLGPGPISSLTSPSPTRRTASGTTIGLGSPFGTPKPRLPGAPGTPSGGTPRPRIPSAIAMPPPASPIRSGKSSVSPPSNNAQSKDSSDATSTADLEARSRALQERIAGLTGVSAPSPPPTTTTIPTTGVPSAPSSPTKRPRSRTAYSRPSSVASTTSARSGVHTPAHTRGQSFGRSLATSARAPSRTSGRVSVSGTGRTSVSGRMSVEPDVADQLEQIQSRVDALEYENDRLRGVNKRLEGEKEVEETEVERLKEEVKRLEVVAATSAAAGSNDEDSSKGNARIAELEAALREAEEQSEQFALKAEELEARVISEGRRGSDSGEHTSESAAAAASAAELSKLRDELKDRDAEIELLKSDLDTAQSTSAAAAAESQAELETLKANLAELESTLSSKTQSLTDAEAALSKAQEEVESLSKVKEDLETKTSALESLEAKHRKQTVDFEEERRDRAALIEDLRAQVDELRQAGQETIALYEDKLRSVEQAKWDLEERVEELEKERRTGAGARTASRTSPSSRRSSVTAADVNGGDEDQTLSLSKILNGEHGKYQTASEIEHSTLLDQIQHLNHKVASLEDLNEDLRVQFEREEAALRDRLGKHREREEGMRKELMETQAEFRKEVDRSGREEGKLRSRLQEVEEALRESGVALEEARAEVEGLKGELANVHGLAASTSSTSGELQQKLSNAQMRAELEKEQFEEKIHELQAELDSLRKKSNRDIAINNGVRSPSKEGKDSHKHELKNANDEITGLKHLLQEVQKESTAQVQRNKVLESENALLMSEMEQLRQEVKILEDNLDQSIMREEENLNLDNIGKDGDKDGADIEQLKKMLKEQRLKFDVEVEQLRKKLADLEMKSARTTHDLNKEISELEALVESKIYREDELEQEIDRLKDKLARAQKKAKSSTGPSEISVTDAQPRKVSTSASSVSSSFSGAHGDEPVCEICEKPGHDIFNCDLLKEDRPLSTTSSINSYNSVNGKSAHGEDLWCEDCESPGHIAEDCPNSEDVF
ncbi:hypothetical protein D9758_013479 [Tetrapyrgos nigripes]|uniref:CAP-Gly domain-containing protein n=1 Tax=Tetrapyrgos nigripes TaxID=182062 RepID=A0A8H5CRB2_9AGAR|nr:hypothetical protein D9758_013479 [Tetrapyrgos nigripes]